MDYVGKVCPYCKDVFGKNDDVVICETCHVIHHKKCWEENQGCTSFGCSGTCQSVHGEPMAQVSREEKKEEKKVENEEKTPPEQRREPSDGYCPSCGAPREPEQRFCQYCGASLVQEQVPQQPDSGSSENAGGQEQKNLQELELLIRDNIPYYRTRFQRMDETKSVVSWNWASAFFFFQWGLYRKMYAEAVIYLLLSIVFSFFPMGGIALFVCGGLFGNCFYKRKLEKWLLEGKTLQGSARQEFFQRRGGTNSLALVLGILLPVIIWFILGIAGFLLYI